MADLTLNSLVGLTAFPTLVAASAGGDRAPNPNSLTTLWVKNIDLEAISLGNRSIDLVVVDSDLGLVDLTDAGLADAFTNAAEDMFLNLSGMGTSANDGFYRVTRKTSNAVVRAQRRTGTSTAESGATTVGIVSARTLRVKTSRESSFGPFDRHYFPCKHGEITTTPSFDARRFNDLNGYLEFDFDDETNITIAAVEHGTIYKEVH